MVLLKKHSHVSLGRGVKLSYASIALEGRSRKKWEE
jgi:hypothetical protein